MKKKPAQEKLGVRKTLFAAILFVICMIFLYAALENRDWNVPEDAKKLTNPLPASNENLAARAIYKEKCAQCHGETGKGDGREAYLHIPTPSDLTDPGRMNAMSDGELFYKISHGKRPMPGFADRLSEEQRWQLVLLIRSFTAQARNSTSDAVLPEQPKP